jgi:hypothetical protein
MIHIEKRKTTRLHKMKRLTNVLSKINYLAQHHHVERHLDKWLIEMRYRFLVVSSLWLSSSSSFIYYLVTYKLISGRLLYLRCNMHRFCRSYVTEDNEQLTVFSYRFLFPSIENRNSTSLKKTERIRIILLICKKIVKFY